MQISAKPVWGHAMVSEKTVRFSHELLAYISDQLLGQRLVGVSYIEREKQNSIIIHTDGTQNTEYIIKTLVGLCTKKIAFFETPKSYYKIPFFLRQSLLSWAISFEGCLAMLLLADADIAHIFHGDFEYINARTGGLYLSPYTLFLNHNHPKVVHPVKLENLPDRLRIEQRAAHYVRLLVRRMEEAHQGMEGIALLSLVEEKTGLSQSSITEIINQKSASVKAPIYSSFFSSCSLN